MINMIFSLKLMIILFVVIPEVFSLKSNNSFRPNEVLKPPVCMTNFLALNYESKTIKTTLFECYSNIIDYKRVIKGYNLQSICFIDEHWINVNKSTHQINRCGEWMEIVGPSQFPIKCMIAGTFKLEENNSDLYNNSTAIAIGEHLFLKITGGLSLHDKDYVQATVTETDFDMGINPSLWVIKKNETHATLQFTDFNRPPEFIEINSRLIRKNYDDTFTVDKYKNKINIKLVSFGNEKVEFEGVDLTSIVRATATARFGHIDIGHCKYLANANILNEKTSHENNLFKWSLFQKQIDGSIEEIDIKNPILTTESGNDDVEIYFWYNTALLFSQDFFEFEAHFLSESDIEITKVKLLISKEIESGNNALTGNLVSDIKLFKVFKDNNTIYLKAPFDPSNFEFANTIGITLSTKSKSVITLKKAKLKRSAMFQNVTECEVEAFDCLHTECTVTNTSKDVGFHIWKDGCIPNCGVCLEGYLCTTAGTCEKESNNNLRSVGILLQTFFSIILFCFIFNSIK
ncbi:hypothetical protein EIN_129110 [Entamoeba invadens IP1]|uniref:Uncharacterized protein n=1 Tax=Entamoeba invadens IP1 TaxID=370355 RepID=L7FN89_ENTIV|nr:hypothetical protein EIN_129110 [Entamoeba invadens IP1]ELP91571.1 hypothetical protein EIN_129110 [Entamoeba invadens IP1]|eukprot:XP_004258342.1 hypothetical protein EIN_129110 [Entamoeba invadens IP1]